MPPKFSETLQPLQHFLKSHIDIDSNSTTTSFSLQMMMNDSKFNEHSPTLFNDTGENNIHSRNFSGSQPIAAFKTN